VTGVHRQPDGTLAESLQQGCDRDDARLDAASTFQHAPHGRQVVERGKRGGDLDRKTGKPCRARGDAENGADRVGAELDGTPQQPIGVGGVIPVHGVGIVLSDLVRLLDVLDERDEVVEADILFVERDDDVPEDRIHLGPTNTVDRAQRPLDGVHQPFCVGPVHTAHFDVGAAGGCPYMAAEGPAAHIGEH